MKQPISKYIETTADDEELIFDVEIPDEMATLEDVYYSENPKFYFMTGSGAWLECTEPFMNAIGLMIEIKKKLNSSADNNSNPDPIFAN